SSGGSAARIVNRDQTQALVDTSKRLTINDLSGILGSVREAEAAVEGNVTPSLVLEALAVRIGPALRSA
ncbi:MAG: hypothetical protein KC561_05015, partial [Myxococcales bacterium]|nr:hypothetical protein [Myxococcales bacterium]